MTEIEKAIAHIEYELEMEHCGNECVVSVNSAELSLTTLREMQEREKGCEWCDNNTTWKADVMPRYTGPNFCPMCGRKLKGGDQHE